MTRRSLPFLLLLLVACDDSAVGNVGGRTSPFGGPANVTGVCTDDHPLVHDGAHCIDTATRPATSGTELVLRPCSGASSQQWTVLAENIVHHSGLCLSADADADWAKTRLAECDGGPAQQWTSRGDTLVSAGGKCLDLYANDSASGTAVQLYTCNGTTAQLWARDVGGSGSNGGGSSGGGDAGLTIDAVISDMVTPSAPPGISRPPLMGMGDGWHAYLTQCLPNSNAMADWIARPPAGTQWRRHYPWLVVLLGEGHQGGEWNIEIADMDMQVFSRAADRWLRDGSYPANPSDLKIFYTLVDWAEPPKHAGSLGGSTVYRVPQHGERAWNPVLHNGIGGGYDDPGDGSDVYSVFVSARARLVPAEGTSFEPSRARIYLEAGSDVYGTSGGVNGNGAPSKLVTADWQTFTFTVFRDDAGSIDVHAPAVPGACDGMPSESWLRAHPPMGVASR